MSSPISQESDQVSDCRVAEAVHGQQHFGDLQDEPGHSKVGNANTNDIAPLQFFDE